jgi:hypothetical protein
MSFQNVQTLFAGQVSTQPNLARIKCTDTVSTITTAGYLTPLINQGYNFSEGDFVLIASDQTGASGLYQVTFSGNVPTLVSPEGIVSGNLVVSGSITSTAGNVTSGSDGDAGTFIAYPGTADKGTLILSATANTGDTNTTITNAAMGQASVLSIPDPGAATANFLLDTGTANILTDNQKFIGINEILIASVGTWTRTRIAQGNYVLRHTAANDTSVIGIDITEAIRTTASKGLRLASIDVIYSIGTLALDAHAMVLDQISYANNAAVSVTSIPLTGSLATATQANPYVSNIEVATPAFLVTADSKYVLELTVDAAATSAYDFYGLNLRFSQTIG